MKYLLAALLLLAVLPMAQAGPAIQHWTTSNGMRVYFVPANELPMVDIRVTFAAGSARDGKQPGVAALTSRMLTQGAGGLSADQIAQAFEDVGAHIGTGALRDMSWLSLRSLSDPEYLEPALDAFTRVLWTPDFPQADFVRSQNQTLLGIKAAEASPGKIASKAFYKALYGDHAYGSPVEGTKASVEKLTTDDLKAFHRRFFVARNGVIAMTGDLTRVEAEKLAERLSSGLKKGEAAPPTAKVPDLEKAQEIRIPFPSRQAHVYMGHPGIERGNPDYYALYLGNHILGGGGFTSRLVKEVRVKRGYAYSVYSYFLLMAAQGPFQIAMQTRGSQVDDAIEVSRETIQQFIDSGPSDEEIEASKKNISGGFPLRIASNGDIVEYLAVIGFYKLPLDYLDTFTKHIEAVSREQIMDAFKRHVHPDNMVTVVVGGSKE
jgi:zinc protease